MVDPESWTTSLGKLEQFAKREEGRFNVTGTVPTFGCGFEKIL